MSVYVCVCVCVCVDTYMTGSRDGSGLLEKVRAYVLVVVVVAVALVPCRMRRRREEGDVFDSSIIFVYIGRRQRRVVLVEQCCAVADLIGCAGLGGAYVCACVGVDGAG